jgi:hypothetical protein
MELLKAAECRVPLPSIRKAGHGRKRKCFRSRKIILSQIPHGIEIEMHPGHGGEVICALK